MKKRFGFVSNSSSSCFLINVDGYNEDEIKNIFGECLEKFGNIKIFEHFKEFYGIGTDYIKFYGEWTEEQDEQKMRQWAWEDFIHFACDISEISRMIKDHEAAFVRCADGDPVHPRIRDFEILREWQE